MDLKKINEMFNDMIEDINYIKRITYYKK